VVPSKLSLLSEVRRLAQARQFDAALQGYQRLTALDRCSAALWLEYGNAAVDAHDFSLADKAYQTAIELEPDRADRLVEIGHCYTLMRRPENALACFARAASVAPTAINPRISMAVALERQHRVDEARAAVDECLALDPRDEQARYFSAVLDRRAGNPESAERILRDLIGSAPAHPVVRHSARYELAQILDQTQRPDEAIRWLSEAKALSWAVVDVRKYHREYHVVATARRSLCAALPRDILRTWERSFPKEQRSAMPALALAGGHPRSGTTLLERILDGHQSIVAVDESSAFSREVIGTLMPSGRPASYDAALFNALTIAQLNDMRQRYADAFQKEAGSLAGGILVDKNPSQTAMLPLWLRVIPELKVLIALRDPRDVVISAYFQNMPLNVMSSNFLSLERTGRHYTDLMDVWLAVRQWEGFVWMETRYEDMVTNLEKEGTRVTNFLGLEWHPDQARFYEKDRQNPIYSPTYHEVTKPIYAHSTGRWRAYEKYLSPCLRDLDRHVRALGY
jgi:Flp pilus assembly protein TadD